MGSLKTDMIVTAGAVACLFAAVIGIADTWMPSPMLDSLLFERRGDVISLILLGLASLIKIFRHLDYRISLGIAFAGLWLATSHIASHWFGMGVEELHGETVTMCLLLLFSISVLTRLFQNHRASFSIPIVCALLSMQAVAVAALLIWVLQPSGVMHAEFLGEFSPYEATLLYVLSAIYFEEVSLDRLKLDQDKSGRHFILRFVFLFPLSSIALCSLPPAQTIAANHVTELAVVATAMIFTANAFMAVLGLGFLRKDMDAREQIHLSNQALSDFVFELQAANDEIRVLSEEQTHLAKKQTEFATILAHEIRTPLNTITGLTSELKESLNGDMDATMVFTLAASVENLLALVNSVLDYNKVREGKLEPVKESFNLSQSLETVAGLYKNRAYAKGLEFSVSVAPNIPRWVVSDEVRIKQILGNLIDNAFKFTAEGIVQVSAVAKTVGKVRTIQISVRDTGIGIPAGSQKQIFEPFKQASSQTQRSYGGTGVGLALCRELAGVLGGSLVLDSSSEAGSTFLLTLPLIEGQPPARSDAPQFDESVLRGMRGLMVEDHPLNIKINSRIFERMGMTIDAVPNGEEAIELVQTETYDVILMDINLNSDMDGLQTTAAIHKLLGSRTPPVIALTASVIDLDSAKFRDSGIIGHLEKPFSKAQALKILGSIRAGAGDSPISGEKSIPSRPLKTDSKHLSKLQSDQA